MLQKFYQKMSAPTNPPSGSMTTIHCANTCASTLDCQIFTFDEHGVCVLYYNSDIPDDGGYYQQTHVID